MHEDYELIKSCVPEFESVDLETYWEMRTLVSSRHYGIVVGGKKTMAMVPFADMFNHKYPKETNWEFSDKFKTFNLKARVDIPKGDQVYSNYGSRETSGFFFKYGFI